MPTTRQEGLPLTILEGMAYGLATLASDIGGISGVITNEIDGILIQPGNQQQLSEQLSKLLINRNRIGEIGQAARSTIVSQYTKEHMVNSTLEVLTGVTNTE